MSEELVIRLGAQKELPCQWLVRSTLNQDVIASGAIENADKLIDLKPYAESRIVNVLVSSVAVSLVSVELPEKGHRQALKAIPFLLEEQLVEDIQKLHFAVGPVVGNQVDVAVVAHEQMQQWLTWLERAELTTKKMIPDCLAVPRTEHAWSMLQLDDQWLIRTGLSKGMTIDACWGEVFFHQVEQQYEKESAALPEVSVFTEIDVETVLTCHQKTIDHPLLILARGAQQVQFNLMSAYYKPRREISKHWALIKTPAVLMSLFICLSLLNSSLVWWRHATKADELKQQMIQVYQEVNPGSKLNVNLIQKQIKNDLQGLTGSGRGDLLFHMVQKIQPGLRQYSEINVDSIKFKASTKQIVISIRADNYEVVESFENYLKKNFTVRSGAMNNSNGVVAGRLIVTEP
jgi:general secretion pathway protein L